MANEVQIKQSTNVIGGMYLAVIAILLTDWLVPGVVIPAWIIAVAWMMIWIVIGLIIFILVVIIIAAAID